MAPGDRIQLLLRSEDVTFGRCDAHFGHVSTDWLNGLHIIDETNSGSASIGQVGRLLSHALPTAYAPGEARSVVGIDICSGDGKTAADCDRGHQNAQSGTYVVTMQAQLVDETAHRQECVHSPTEASPSQKFLH